MGDKGLPIQVSTIALNNKRREEKKGYPQNRNRKLGLTNYKLCSLSTLQQGRTLSLQRYKDTPFSHSRTWHQHGKSCIFGEASIKNSNIEIPKIHHTPLTILIPVIHP